MKLGAEPKKVQILIGLIVLAGIAYWYSSSDSPTPAPSRAAAPVGSAPIGAAVPVQDSAPRVDRKRPSTQANMGEFKPGIGPKRGEAKRDPTTIDPTLRLDLLAKVQSVQPESSLRNVFVFGVAQQTAKPLPDLPKNVPQIAMGPKAPVVLPPALPPGPPPTPPPPAITFKYYGYKVSKANGLRQAFLLDGEDIILAGENDMIKKRYKIVKIGANSITIEDTQYKHSQTLPLQEDVVA